MDTIIHDKSSTSYIKHIYKTFILPLIKMYTVNRKNLNFILKGPLFLIF